MKLENTRVTKEQIETRLDNMRALDDEIKDIIINYQEYKEGYIQTIYQFIIDNSIFYVVADHETDGLDLIIDHLEAEEMQGYFIDVLEYHDDYIIDTDNIKYYDDEYIIGGNCGHYLYHGGNFRIEELTI